MTRQLTLSEYQQKSLRTMSYGGSPKYVHDYNNFLLNYSLGLVGEAIEVVEAFEESLALPKNVQNVLKELGDVAHYAVGLAGVYDIELPDTVFDFRSSLSETVHDLLKSSKEISEHTKKKIFHDHEDKLDAWHLINIFDCISIIANTLGYNLSEVLSINLEKLAKRYPEGFSSEGSIERVDV